MTGRRNIPSDNILRLANVVSTSAEVGLSTSLLLLVRSGWARAFFPAPPLIMLQDTHQRSKNAKKGVPLSQLRRSLKMEKRVLFSMKNSRFLKKRGTFLKETWLTGCNLL